MAKVTIDFWYPNLREDSSKDQVGETREEEACPVEAEDVEEVFEGGKTVHI